MRINKKVMKSFLTGVFLALVFTTIANGQTKELSLNTVPIPPKTDKLQHEVIDYFAEAFKQNNIELNYEADYELLISAKELPSANEVILSITKTKALGKNAVELAAQHELIYADMQKGEDLPEEGKFVREMMTRELIYSYRAPMDNDLMIVKRNKLKKFINDYVKNLSF